MNTTNQNKNEQGVVFKKISGKYSVHAAGRIIPCELSSRLRKQGELPVAGRNSKSKNAPDDRRPARIDPVAVGDEVRFIEAQGGRGLIVEVLPRRNKLARRTAVPMPDAHPFEQVIVANVGQVVPVFSAANPSPKWNMLDRYLVAAESARLAVLICITKVDLARSEGDGIDQGLWEALGDYRKAGYPVLLTSAVSGDGLPELKQALQGQTSVLVGKSGVGKTSLLNALQPGLGLRVNEVSKVSGRGKHTTTHMEMFPLESGGALVDTPGVREFGLWDIQEDDLASFFPEMRPFVGSCKFGLDCQHDEEPGCAVRRAVMGGHISPRRYQSYLRLKVDP